MLLHYFALVCSYGFYLLAVVKIFRFFVDHDIPRLHLHILLSGTLLANIVFKFLQQRSVFALQGCCIKLKPDSNEFLLFISRVK